MVLGSDVCTWTNPSSYVGLVVVGDVEEGASGEEALDILKKVLNFLSCGGTTSLFRVWDEVQRGG